MVWSTKGNMANPTAFDPVLEIIFLHKQSKGSVCGLVNKVKSTRI